MASKCRLGALGVEPWDTEWAAEKAAEALRYLVRNYPECLENLRVLNEHEMVVHEAALLRDREGCLDALGVYEGRQRRSAADTKGAA